MKYFLLMAIFSVSVFADCNYEIRDRRFRTSEEQREFRCELNFKCTEIAIKDIKYDLEVIEKLADYSRKNKCNDELRLADLFAALMAEETGEDPAVDNSERGNTKADLPVIPDAPSSSSSQTGRQ